MLSHSISPVVFRIGFVQVTWYALVYLAGFVFAVVLLLRASRRREIKMSEEQVYGLVFSGFLGMMIGARLFHVLFWGFDYYLADLGKVLEFWRGGFSFHGGLVGGFLVSWFYCKKEKIHFWKTADLLALLGIAMPIFSRIANFINQEIVGTLTSVGWCFEFVNHFGCRHPVQLYASFGRLMFLVFVLRLRGKLREWKDGFIFWLFIIGIGIGRFVLDFWREDLIYFGLKAGQWLSLPMIIAGGWVLWKFYRKDVRKIA